MIGFHVTTTRKLERYKATRGILPPVRFWPNLYSAQRWAKRTGRDIVLQIEVEKHYPLPDHRPAHWSPDFVTKWEIM